MYFFIVYVTHGGPRIFWKTEPKVEFRFRIIGQQLFILLFFSVTLPYTLYIIPNFSLSTVCSCISVCKIMGRSIRKEKRKGKIKRIKVQSVYGIITLRYVCFGVDGLSRESGSLGDYSSPILVGRSRLAESPEDRDEWN